VNTHALSSCDNETKHPAVAVRITFKPETEETLRQEVALLMSVLDEAVSDMMLFAEAGATNEESSDISSPS
jgi:hypothetical protein